MGVPGSIWPVRSRAMARMIGLVLVGKRRGSHVLDTRREREGVLRVKRLPLFTGGTRSACESNEREAFTVLDWLFWLEHGRANPVI